MRFQIKVRCEEGWERNFVKNHELRSQPVFSTVTLPKLKRLKTHNLPGAGVVGKLSFAHPLCHRGIFTNRLMNITRSSHHGKLRNLYYNHWLKMLHY